MQKQPNKLNRIKKNIFQKSVKGGKHNLILSEVLNLRDRIIAFYQRFTRISSMLLLLHVGSNNINNQKEDKANAEKLTEDIINVGKSCINFSLKEAIISSTLTKNNTALTRLIQQVKDILREQCILNKFGFIFNDNRSKTNLWKDGTHSQDSGTDILASNFDGFLNRFILSKSSKHS